jgi:hypothetical protein
VTSAVTAELLRYCDEVVLNVRSDNPPAIQAYTRLGFVEHARFEERLVRRLASPWADLTAPIRRLFGRRPDHPVAARPPEDPSGRFEQAHQIDSPPTSSSPADGVPEDPR